MACHNFGPSIALALVGSHWTSAVVQRTFGAKYRPDDVYAGDLFSALGAIDSGVTCVLDWSHIHNTPEQTDAAIKALAESGVRAVFAYGNPQNETGRYWEMKGHNFPRTLRVCENNCAKPSGRLEGNDESQMPTLRRDSRDVSAGDIY